MLRKINVAHTYQLNTKVLNSNEIPKPRNIGACRRR